MAGCKDKQFGLAICDVPYGIDLGNMTFLKEQKTTVKQKNGGRLNGNGNKKPYARKDWDKKTPDQAYFDELQRVSKHQIIFGVDYVDWTGLGSGRIKWNKGMAEGMSFKPYETAYCSKINTVVDLDLLWAGMCQAGSLSEPMRQQGNKRLNEKRIHPCHKPVLLYIKLLSDYASPGDTILDTHLGSGSSRIACDKMGFDFVGTEIDPDYYNAHLVRWENYKKQLVIEF